MSLACLSGFINAVTGDLLYGISPLYRPKLRWRLTRLLRVGIEQRVRVCNGYNDIIHPQGNAPGTRICESCAF